MLVAIRVAGRYPSPTIIAALLNGAGWNEFIEQQFVDFVIFVEFFQQRVLPRRLMPLRRDIVRWGWDEQFVLKQFVVQLRDFLLGALGRYMYALRVYMPGS